MDEAPWDRKEDSQEMCIGSTVAIRGEIEAQDRPLEIFGTVEGTVTHGHRLRIHEGARVSADLHASEIFIDGVVEGGVHGASKVSLSETAEVNGNIHAPRFSVVEGARIKGEVLMDADL